jgi:hypothetical protein
VPSYGGVLELWKEGRINKLTIKKCKRTSRKNNYIHGLCMIFHVPDQVAGRPWQKNRQTKFGFIDDKRHNKPALNIFRTKIIFLDWITCLKLSIEAAL